MDDEKDIKAEELTDEQADKASGGVNKRRTSIYYNCYNFPRCRETVSAQGAICEKCRAKMRGN